MQAIERVQDFYELPEDVVELVIVYTSIQNSNGRTLASSSMETNAYFENC